MILNYQSGIEITVGLKPLSIISIDPSTMKTSMSTECQSSHHCSPFNRGRVKLERFAHRWQNSCVSHQTTRLVTPHVASRIVDSRRCWLYRLFLIGALEVVDLFEVEQRFVTRVVLHEVHGFLQPIQLGDEEVLSQLGHLVRWDRVACQWRVFRVS